MSIGGAPKPPDPGEFAGRSPRLFYMALIYWLQRLVEWLFRKQKPHSILVYTQGGGISARSGTTVGSGTVEVVTWNGTALDPSGNGTLTVYNAYGAAFTGSAYVWCDLWRGVYWARDQECT
jgi:hypothetical protein